MKSRWIPALLLSAVGMCSLASPAAAGTRVYLVDLTGAAEVPPVVTGGTGQCVVNFNDVTGAVSVSGTFSGLTSNATLAHIHGPAPVGMNAGILITLTETGGTSGSVSGSGTFSPANITNMLNGLMYVNIHTVNNGGGELRGQITQEVPAMPWPWMAALTVLALGGGAFVLTRRGATAAC
jgi:hypothetical protein